MDRGMHERVKWPEEWWVGWNESWKDGMKLAHLYCGEGALTDTFKRELLPVGTGTILSIPASTVRKSLSHTFWDSHNHRILNGQTQDPMPSFSASMASTIAGQLLSPAPMGEGSGYWKGMCQKSPSKIISPKGWDHRDLQSENKSTYDYSRFPPSLAGLGCRESTGGV